MNRVIVCGLPSSGNRLVANHFQRAGLTATVIHNHPDGELLEYATDGTAFVCPYSTDFRRWAESNLRARRHWVFDPSYIIVHAEAVRSAGAKRICLEAIKRTRGGALDVLMRAMGIKPPDWPEVLPPGEHPSVGPVIP